MTLLVRLRDEEMQVDDRQRSDTSRQRVQRVDVSLVEAAFGGDQDAVNNLFTLAYPRVLRFLMHLAHERELARDLTQDTLVLASQRLHQLTAAESFEPWLLRIARNTYYESRNQPRLRRSLSLDQMQDRLDEREVLIDWDHAIESYPTREAVMRTLVRLKPLAREIIFLRYVAGYSGGEMSVVLDISTSAVYQRLHRAVADFERIYQQLDNEQGQVALESTQ